MRRNRILTGVAALSTVLATTAAMAGSVSAGAAARDGAVASSSAEVAADTGSSEYVVLYRAGQGAANARAAISRSGGRVVEENTKIGFAVVRTADPAFAVKVNDSGAVEGAARNRVIGVAPKQRRADVDDIERLTAESNASKGRGGQADAPAAKATAAVTPEPLAGRQWDMRQIGATANRSYAKEQGSRRVLVGIIDTGIDGAHPDIAPNFNGRLSQNFVTDIPSVDGPCEVPSCVDPADEDDNGHGTHVASTIGSPINGLGIAGVAPKVTLVNLRAGQDSGFFFLLATLKALIYAGDIGVDVVNMSFFTDPWLYNCLKNPADSPAEQTEQRVIRVLTQRAMNYAVNHGVLPVAAEGNEATDLGNPTFDDVSPDYPPGNAKERTVDNSCITVPTETRGVLVVSSTGPSTRKAYYSNYGTEQTDVAAPGGDLWDSPDKSSDVRNLVLAAYPKRVAELDGEIDQNGMPTTPFVVRDCLDDGTCAYYRYLQGTSMASPHAAGVAALVVSHFGRGNTSGLGLAANRTRSMVQRTAVPHACPQPRLFEYTRADGTELRPPAFCAGPPQNNGFYGHGIVNAYAAVTARR